MTDTLTATRIIEAAEDAIRRFGPEKTNVVDVARQLGVSHGSVYRHFASKAALRDAVVEAWLRRVADPLEAIAASDEPPDQRLRHWFVALRQAKRDKVEKDPQLFKISREIFALSHDVVHQHVEHMTAQIERIVADGVASGVFRRVDPRDAATALFDGTARFHDPAHALEWSTPGDDAAFERVLGLLLAGLRP